MGPFENQIRMCCALIRAATVSWSSKFKCKRGMAEFSGGGLDFDYGDVGGLGGSGTGGMSSDEDYETMTPAEVLEKLEEV